MLLQLLQDYVDVINDTTRMTQRSATAMAETMLRQAGMEPVADLVTQLSEQLLAAQEAQWEMMRQLIQSEVDMTVARMQPSRAYAKQSPNQAAPALREASADAEAATPRIAEVAESAQSSEDMHAADVPLPEAPSDDSAAVELKVDEPEPDTSVPYADEQAVDSSTTETEPQSPTPVADADSQPETIDAESEPTPQSEPAENQPEAAVAVAPTPKASAKRAPAARKATARKSTASKPAATRATASKPAATRATASKPAATKATASKPAATRATTAKSPSTRSNTAGAGQAASKRKTDAPKATGTAASGNGSTSGEASEANS